MCNGSSMVPSFEDFRCRDLVEGSRKAREREKQDESWHCKPQHSHQFQLAGEFYFLTKFLHLSTYIYHSKPHANRVCGHWVTSGYSPSQSKPSEPGLFLSLHQLHRTGRSQNLNKLLLNEVIVVITVNQRSRHCPILTVECRILAIFIVLSFMWVTNETALHPVFLLSQFSCMLIMPTPIDYYYIAGTPVSTDRLTLQQLQNVLLLHTFLMTVLLAYRMLALDPESSISKCVFQLLDLQGLFVNICLVSVFSPQDISSIISSYPP